jgi:hypothetical protein
MVETSGSAVLKKGGAERFDLLNHWNSNIDLRKFNYEVDGPERQFVTRLEDAFINRQLIKVAAISGAEVFDGDANIGNVEFTMKTGDTDIVDYDIITGVTPDAIKTGFQRQFRAGNRSRLVNEPHVEHSTRLFLIGHHRVRG